MKEFPKLKDFASRKDWEAASWNYIIQTLARIKKPEEVKKFLRRIISPAEIKTITYRVAGGNLLKEGKSYGYISNELWLTRQTISAIKKSFGQIDYKSNRAYPRIPRRQSSVANLDQRGKIHKFGSYRKTKYGKIRMP